MTSSGLWTPNRYSDLTLERGPIWCLLWALFLEVQMVPYPLRMASYHGSSGAHEVTPAGNPRVHGMIHHIYTIPLEGGPQEGLR